MAEIKPGGIYEKRARNLFHAHHSRARKIVLRHLDRQLANGAMSQEMYTAMRKLVQGLNRKNGGNQ